LIDGEKVAMHVTLSRYLSIYLSRILCYCTYRYSVITLLANCRFLPSPPFWRYGSSLFRSARYLRWDERNVVNGKATV
jgi:hypothetical protein